MAKYIHSLILMIQYKILFLLKFKTLRSKILLNRNEIAVYPEADLGICVLLNSNSKIARTVIPDLYKIINQVYSKTSSKTTPDKHSIAGSTY